EAHTGVDVLLRQRTRDVEVDLGPHLGQQLLHEDEVPDLGEPVVVDDRAAVATVGGSAIDVDLRAGAGRTGLTGVPVVVLFAHALDALDGQARDLLPQGGGFVVGVVDGDPDVLLCEGEVAV